MFKFETPVAYNETAKRKFHSQGKARMRALAKALALPDGSYDIRSNMGGIAVSGEITLHHERVYVQVYQSCIGDRAGILIRTCKSRKDYTGGRNFHLPIDNLNDPDNIKSLARYVRNVVCDSIWMATPAEYRSLINGSRYVLDNQGAKGTCLVPLETSSKVI